MLAVAPAPELEVFAQSGIRLLAELIVCSLLLAAVSFWDP